MSTAQKIIEHLQAFDIKEESEGRYRSNSPLRVGSNSHGFTVVIHDDEHGAFFDHVTEEKGSLYELATRLGIALPDAQTTITTKRAYKSLEHYANAHGIAGSVLQSWGWMETEVKGRHALQFPTRTGKRWRFLDGVKPYYMSERGYTRCWYGLNSAVAKRLAEGAAFVICNGEISTIAAQYYGLAAAAITGGENSLPLELLQQLKAFLGGEAPPVTVAFDCDDKGRNAARKLVSQLRSAGFVARAADLGLGLGGDLADFVMLHQQDSSAKLTQCPTLSDKSPLASTPTSWRLVPRAALHTLPKISYLVEGIIPERGLVVIYGPSGVGKTFFSLDVALTIAQESKVVYMAAEGEYGYNPRITAWETHHNKSGDNLVMCLGAVPMLDSGNVEMFIEACQAYEPKAVFIDTLARAMPGADENSSRDMGLFIQSCDKVARNLDAVTILVHHTGKYGTNERGSSALRGASDVMVQVVGDDDIIKVECSKTKDAKPFDDRYYKLLPVNITLDGGTLEQPCIVPAEKVQQTPDDPLGKNQRKVLEVLTLSIYEDGAVFSDLLDSCDVSRSQLPRTLSRLKDLGFVTQEGRGKPYKVSESGKKALGMPDLDSPDSLDSSDSPESEEKQQSFLPPPESFEYA